MILQQKTLEKLRDLINEETEYRKGHQLVKFFNELGFKDEYGQGFPSRWIYTDEKLRAINGKPEIDKCIKKVFAPVTYIGRFGELDKFIRDFNQYLAFDGWKVERQDKEIIFTKAGKIDFTDEKTDQKVDDFLQKEFENVSINALGLGGEVTKILTSRMEEIKKSLSSQSPLSVIFLAGSSLEGILLGIAIKNPESFNRAKSCPKNEEGKSANFPEWSLNNFIDVAHETGFIKEDVKKFSHALRDFRNYIHPYEQLSHRFNPDMHTARICWQVLKAAIYQISLKK
jgi:hypothetical protein